MKYKDRLVAKGYVQK
jgi:hypothetical protein